MEKQSGIGILEEFRIEFLDCWQRLPNKAFFLILLAAWAVLYQFIGNSTLGYIHTPSLYAWLWDAYLPPNVDARDDAHGPLIPFVVLGLLWWKREELLSLKLRLWWPGLLLVAFGLLIHALGYLAQQPRVSTVGLLAGIYGLTGLAWGPDWLRATFFPFFLFVFSVPLGVFLQPITFPLRLLVCRLVESFCHVVLDINVVRDGTALLDPTQRYRYEVAAACSGIRSLMATVMLSVIYAWVSFRPWWKRGLLLASAVPLAVLGNSVRLLSIILAAEYFGGQSAGDYVHEGGPGGVLSLLPYVPAFAGLLLLGHWLREPAPPSPAPAVPLEATTP